MRRRTSSATFGWPFNARETVATDTFACRATSLIVTLIVAGLLPGLSHGCSRRHVWNGRLPAASGDRCSAGPVLVSSRRHHLEARGLLRLRAAAREHGERARLDHAPHVHVVQRQ